MNGPELGGLLLGEPAPMVVTDQVVDDIATSAVRDFLNSVSPQELEVRALSLLGGLEGDNSVGAAMLQTLREMAGVE